MKQRLAGVGLLALLAGCDANTGNPTFGGWVVLGTLAAVLATVIVCALHEAEYGGLPFTTRGEMGRAYAKERDRRASEFVKLGIDPKDALHRAVSDMRKEAEDALKQDGK